MLTGVYDGFGEDDHRCEPEFADPRDVTAPENRRLSLIWRRQATIWPGDMLEDVTGNCFYAAGGLQPGDLDYLQHQPLFSPATVARRFGDYWLQTHLPRLVALGFVGRTTT